MGAQENKQLIQKSLNDYIEGNADTFFFHRLRAFLGRCRYAIQTR